MKIYFACSIHGQRGGRKEKDMMVSVIKDLGHQVLTEIFPTRGVKIRGKKLGPEKIYQEDMKWIAEADCLVADVTRLSLGVGYEIGWSVARKKKVVALCREDKFLNLSLMIQGDNSGYLHLYKWGERKDVERILRKELGNGKAGR